MRLKHAAGQPGLHCQSPARHYLQTRNQSCIQPASCVQEDHSSMPEIIPPLLRRQLMYIHSLQSSSGFDTHCPRQATTNRINEHCGMQEFLRWQGAIPPSLSAWQAPNIACLKKKHAATGDEGRRPSAATAGMGSGKRANAMASRGIRTRPFLDAVAANRDISPNHTTAAKSNIPHSAALCLFCGPLPSTPVSVCPFSSTHSAHLPCNSA